MSFDIVVGSQYGDEGKGKVVSHLANADDVQIVVRGGVGPNAGHQVNIEGTTYSLRQMPSGFVNKKARMLIGAGVLVNPSVFLNELKLLSYYDVDKRTGIDYRCTAILPKHIAADSGDIEKKIGTTGSGCGPANMERVARKAILVNEIEELKPYLTDVPKEVNAAKRVLIEGTQGFMLSLLYGTYPFVTSKDTSASTIAADVGVGPTKIDDVIMILKSYTTRVGHGPLRDELTDLERIKALGFFEKGTVTGRVRRVSEKLHWDELAYAAMVNGTTQLALTKLDVRFAANAGVTKYDKLTKEAKAFVEDIEKHLKLPVTLIGTGPRATDIIDRRK